MDLSSRTIREIIHPTAAYTYREPRNETTSLSPLERPLPAPQSWEDSQLNPKNRIDSLDPLQTPPLWIIQGCTGFGTQYFVSPSPALAPDFPPMRYDVFIAEDAANSPLLRALLDLDQAFHTKDQERLVRLGIANYISRTLQYLTTHNIGLFSCEAVKIWPATKPFGSRLIFDSLAMDIRKVKVSFMLTHYLERQLESPTSLQATWADSFDDPWPRQVDITSLRSVRRLHDSVTLVTTSSSTHLWIFKALTSSPKYLYHELKTLLAMPPYPNIVSRPSYLVVKRGLFGNRSLVVGMLLPYHSGGNLRDLLPLRLIHHQLHLEDQLRWSMQLTQALLHSRVNGGIFYPDLRLENIVLSAAGDAVMVDFEQRGVWCEFAAPEINALQYLLILAEEAGLANNMGDRDAVRTEEEETQADITGTGMSISARDRERFRHLLTAQVPGWEHLHTRETYSNVPSFNVPWLCLEPREQEAAEVFMLGRVLWCIFEGACAPERSAVWQSYAREPAYDFPEFRHTPLDLRDLINECTRGRRDALSSRIIREESRLVVRRPDVGGGEDNAGDDTTARTGSTGHGYDYKEEEEVRRVAKTFWQAEIAAAEEMLAARERARAEPDWQGNFFQRPTLLDVLQSLIMFCDEHMIRQV